MTTTARTGDLPELRGPTGHTEDEWWAALDPELHPEPFMTRQPDHGTAWLALGDVHLRASHRGNPGLGNDVELLVLACAALLRTHCPDHGGACTRCHDDHGRSHAWPCRIWQHFTEWLAPPGEDEPVPA